MKFGHSGVVERNKFVFFTGLFTCFLSPHTVSYTCVCVGMVAFVFSEGVLGNLSFEAILLSCLPCFSGSCSLDPLVSASRGNQKPKISSPNPFSFVSRCWLYSPGVCLEVCALLPHARVLVSLGLTIPTHPPTHPLTMTVPMRFIWAGSRRAEHSGDPRPMPRPAAAQTTGEPAPARPQPGARGEKKTRPWLVASLGPLFGYLAGYGGLSDMLGHGVTSCSQCGVWRAALVPDWRNPLRVFADLSDLSFPDPSGIISYIFTADFHVFYGRVPFARSFPTTNATGQAMFLLVPDPSPLDPQLRGLWDWLQQRVEQCPSTLPDSVLSELVDTLLTRVQCSAASREEVIPIALALTESFMYQVRTL